MFSRIRYALDACWSNRLKIKAFLLDPKSQLASVTDINPQFLTKRGVKALVLDFDGVLAAHAEAEPRLEVQSWLQAFEREYYPNQVYILSNKPTLARQAYFKQNFPGIKFILAKRKKPYPDGIEEIIAHSGLSPEQILLVDDRLATGIIAAIVTGIQGCWLNKPYVNFRARPIRETFFMSLRWLERILIKII